MKMSISKYDVELSNKQKMVKQVSILGVIVNFILLSIKLFTGILSNSASMIADGLHSFEDMMSSIIALIGIKVSSRKPDITHPYGYGKCEYIFSIVISILMVITSVTMFKNVFQNYIAGYVVVFNKWLIFTCLLTIVIKFVVYRYTNQKLKVTGDILIKASKEDHKNDILVTSGVLISTVCSYYGFYAIDLILSGVIAIWIGIVGIKVFCSSYSILSDKNMSEYEIKEIESKIIQFDEVEKVENLIAKPIDFRYLLILKMKVGKDVSLEKSYTIEKRVKNEILKRYDNIYDVIVSIMPC